MAEIDEHKLLKEALPQNQAQPQLFYQINRDLNKAKDEAELLQILAQPAINAGATSANLLYFDLDQENRPIWAEVVAGWQIVNPIGSRFYLPDFPLAGFWLSNPYEPVLITDVLVDSRCNEIVHQFSRQLGIRSIAIIPLTKSDRWVGLLSFSWPVAHSFTPLEIELYHALQNLAAPIVENRRMVTKLEQIVAERTLKLQQEIAERLQTEDALQESKNQFKLIYDLANAFIMAHDRDFKVVYMNPYAHRALGYEPGSKIGTDIRLLLEQSEYERAEPVRNSIEIDPDLKVEGFEQYYLRRDGSRVLIRWNVSALKDKAGVPWGILGVGQDITAQKQLEIEREQLVTNLEKIVAERTAALSRSEAKHRAYAVELEQSNQQLQDFAYIASHDLQEPLRKIHAFSDRLKSRYNAALDERGLDYLARIQQAVIRMQTLIQDLLTFSRVTTKAQPFVRVDLNKIILEVLSDLEMRIDEVKGQVRLGKLPTIEADPTQIRQLFQNLISNALKFHRPGHAPVVNIESHEGGPEGCIQVLIADNGIGFDEKYIDRIFGVFQRLHGQSEYEGTGIGLAICRKIVERHQGNITASSAPDQGAVFVVTLPLKQTENNEAVSL
jgi:PAS domain S-box-containing protein